MAGYKTTPSHAHRWLKCSVAPRLSAAIPKEETTYSEAGRLAHRYAEAVLQEALGGLTGPVAEACIDEVEQHEEYTPEMARSVFAYTGIVLEDYNAMKARRSETRAFIELKLSMTPYIPCTSGYADCAIVSGPIAKLYDFKDGNTKVSAERNAQMMLYAAALLEMLKFTHEIEFVELAIIQPRANNISRFTYSSTEIRQWARNKAQPKAALAKAGGTTANAGDWCGYCPARFTCTTRAEAALSEVRDLFGAEKPELLTTQQVAKVLSEVEFAEKWLKDARKFLHKQLSSGEETSHYKLVQGRSTRKWLNEKDVIKTLRGMKFKKAEYINEKLCGIKAATDLLGVDGLEEHLGDMIHRPAGGPVLAPANDDRDDFNLNSAFAAFDKLNS